MSSGPAGWGWPAPRLAFTVPPAAVPDPRRVVLEAPVPGELVFTGLPLRYTGAGNKLLKAGGGECPPLPEAELDLQRD